MSDSAQAKTASNKDVRHDAGHEVTSYLDLATKVAELQFRNREHILLFRGQGSDRQNKNGNTTLKPSIFRPNLGGDLGNDTLEERYRNLRHAEELLGKAYQSANHLGRQLLGRHRILRWALLQHYEVCLTPLLDVTHSLRIAASFASLSGKREVWVFVLGVPNLSGAVTASAEAGLQIVRLSSVCPPAALRPHVQEGYLLGEYPDIEHYEQNQKYKSHEVDFARRLVAKFRFKPDGFWKGDAFPKVGRLALYPNADDPIFELTKSIRQIR